MTIAVHISSKIKNDFFLNCFLSYASQNIDDHIILISDGKFNVSKTLPVNCTPVSLEPLIKNQLLKYYWYNFKFPSILNRYSADVYFSPIFAAGLKSNVPAIILLHQFTETADNILSASNIKYLRFAKYICSTNPVQLQHISERYPFIKQKLFEFPLPSAREFIPLDYDSQMRINQQISNGNDHFITVATAGNKNGIITLLKAFSIFKKWQKSSLELIIINRAGNNNIVPQIESYKYKTSVHIISCKQDEEHELIASSYAFIDISDLSTGKEYVLKTMSCGIPVISTFPLKNVFGEAVMYSENTEKSISEKMMLVYKDEELRYKIIEKGNYFVASNSHEKMLEAIKNITEKALEQTS